MHTLRYFGDGEEDSYSSSDIKRNGSRIESLERTDLLWSLGFVKKSPPKALCSGSLTSIPDMNLAQ